MLAAFLIKWLKQNWCQYAGGSPMPVLSASTFHFAHIPPHPCVTHCRGASHAPANPAQPRPRSPQGENFLPTLTRPPPTNKTFQTSPWFPNTSVNVPHLPASSYNSSFSPTRPQTHASGVGLYGRERKRKGSRGKVKTWGEGKGSKRDARKQTSGAVPVPATVAWRGQTQSLQGNPLRLGTFRRVRMRQS